MLSDAETNVEDDARAGPLIGLEGEFVYYYYYYYFVFINLKRFYFFYSLADLPINEEIEVSNDVPEVWDEIEVVAGPSSGIENRDPAGVKKPRKTRNAQGIDLDVTLLQRPHAFRQNVDRRPGKRKLKLFYICVFFLFLICYCFLIFV